MVFVKPFIGAAVLLSTFVSALPRPDSAIGEEVAVSAPNGTPISDTAALAKATASAAAQSGCGGGSCGGDMNMNMGSGCQGSSCGGDMNMGSGCQGSSCGGDMNMGSGCQGSSCGGDMNMGSGCQGDSCNMNGGSSMQATSTMMAQATQTSYPSPSHGSGSSNWGGSGYNSCVQQCVAQFGSPPTQWKPTEASASSEGSTGTGATHTVIVAPTQGVLRYVPFAVNASVGDTVKFIWGAGPHTVTKSSELTPCNKTGDAPFISGIQNKTFVFTQVVNDTNPTFYYCGVPEHCQKGMFGIINPPSGSMGAPSTVDMMAGMMSSNDSTMAAQTAAMEQACGSNQMAKGWGGNMDMSKMPSWSQPLMIENTYYTRTFLAANPDVQNPDGSVNLGNAGDSPLLFPQDLDQPTDNVAAAAAAAKAPASTGSNTASTPSTTKTSGAIGTLSSPRALVAAAAGLVAYFSL